MFLDSEFKNLSFFFFFKKGITAVLNNKTEKNLYILPLVTLVLHWAFSPSNYFRFSPPSIPEIKVCWAFLRQRLPGLFRYQSFEAARGMLSEVDM